MKSAVLETLDVEPGGLRFHGVPYLLIRPDTIVDFQKAVESAVGQERCAEMMMAGGFTGGSGSSQRYGEALDYNGEEIVRFMCEMGGNLGWGIFDLVLLDRENGRLVIEVMDSPFAVAYGRSDHSVCHLIRGVLAGLGSTVFQSEVSSSETACMAKGDGSCRFEVTK